MINSLYVVFEALSIIFCLHYLYGEKVKADKLTIGIIIIDVIWMNLIFYQKLNSNASLVIYLMYFIYCGVKFGFHIKRMIINNILYTILLCALQAALMAFSYFVFRGILPDEQLRLLINFIVLIIVVTCLKRIKLQKLSKVLESNGLLTGYSLIVLIIGGVLFLFGFKLDGGFTMFYFLVLLMCIVLIVFIAIDIGKHKAHAVEIESELKVHKLYENSFRSLVDDICAKQHEFDNHINAIYNQHILFKEYDELILEQRKYCNTMMIENRYNKLLSKGNPIILGFLYSKFIEAEKCGVRVKYKISIGDLEDTLPVYKLIEILGNLIKNATEELLSQEKEKLWVKMIENSEKIYIEVGNESEKIDYAEIHKYFTKGYSKKGDKRGYGLYNVKKICDDYNINISCEFREKDISMLVFALEINKSL